MQLTIKTGSTIGLAGAAILKMAHLENQTQLAVMTDAANFIPMCAGIP